MLSRPSRLVTLVLLLPFALAPSAGWAQGVSDAALVGTFLRSWSSSWESRDIDLYAAHYAEDLRAGREDRDAWVARKGRLFSRASFIEVDISAIAIRPTEDGWMVEFRQRYASDGMSDDGFKTLVIRRAPTLRIVGEGWVPLADGRSFDAQYASIADIFAPPPETRLAEKEPPPPEPTPVAEPETGPSGPTRQERTRPEPRPRAATKKPAPPANPVVDNAPLDRFKSGNTELLALTRGGASVVLALNTVRSAPVSGGYFGLMVFNHGDEPIRIDPVDGMVYENQQRKQEVDIRTVRDVVRRHQLESSYASAVRDTRNSYYANRGGDRSISAARFRLAPREVDLGELVGPVPRKLDGEEKGRDLYVKLYQKSRSQGAFELSTYDDTLRHIFGPVTVEPGQWVAGVLVTSKFREIEPHSLRVALGDASFAFDGIVTPWLRQSPESPLLSPQ